MGEHEIKCVRDSDRTLHSEAGGTVRQIADRAIDSGPVTFEGDVRPFECAVALRLPSPLCRVFFGWALRLQGLHDCGERSRAGTGGAITPLAVADKCWDAPA